MIIYRKNFPKLTFFVITILFSHIRNIFFSKTRTKSCRCACVCVCMIMRGWVCACVCVCVGVCLKLCDGESVCVMMCVRWCVSVCVCSCANACVLVWVSVYLCASRLESVFSPLVEIDFDEPQRSRAVVRPLANYSSCFCTQLFKWKMWESEKNQRRNEKWSQHLKRALSHGKNCCIWQSDLEIFSASAPMYVYVCVCVRMCVKKAR